MGLTDLLRRFLSQTVIAASPARTGTSGTPSSSNGASSSHLFWQLPILEPGEKIIKAEADIEIMRLPERERLFFWALQATFSRSGQQLGAGHLGLQFYPAHPGNGAVNWGGYYGSGSSETGELPGSDLRLQSTPGNPNTGDYLWTAGHRYRYRIDRSPERGWRGSIIESATGSETVIRDLLCDGDELTNLMVWTEAFADCDDPPTAARWSNLRVTTNHGRELTVDAVRVNYQSLADGGCITSDCAQEESEGAVTGITQRTGVPRTTAQGSVLSL